MYSTNMYINQLPLENKTIAVAVTFMEQNLNIIIFWTQLNELGQH